MSDAPESRPVAPTFPLWVRVTHWLNAGLVIALVLSGLEIVNAHNALYLGEHSDRVFLSLPTFKPPLTLGGWLAGGRRAHFAAAALLVANGLVYLGLMLAGRRKRAVWPYRQRGPVPPGAYAPLQRLAYAGVALGLAPLLVGSGLAMSPQWDAIAPFYTDLFGGRQTARTIHFFAMAALVGFLIGHTALVAHAGWPHLRRMITGRPVGGSDG